MEILPGRIKLFMTSEEDDKNYDPWTDVLRLRALH